jgi:hypothetical protein
LILIVILLDLPQNTENLLVFCCSCPLLPISWAIGKILKVDIFDKSNPLGNVGFLFTCNQFLYLLIVMWVFNAVPDKMVMVYAMVFGAHLLPYSWLYKSISYRIFAIIIPVLSLVIGCFFLNFLLHSRLSWLNVYLLLLCLQSWADSLTSNRQLQVYRTDKIPLGTKGRTSILSCREYRASCGVSFSVSRKKLPDGECFVTSFRQGGYTPLRR